MPRCVSSWTIWYTSVPLRETSPTDPGHADLPGMIPTFAAPGEIDARAVRPDQPRPRCLEVAVDVGHVADGDALGDTHDEPDAGIGRLEDRLRREPWRDEDHRGVRAGLRHRARDRVEDRDPLDVLTALARRDAGDDLRPVVAVAERVERPLVPGDALDHEARPLVDEDAHAVAPARSAASSAASSMFAAGTIRGWAASAGSSARPRRSCRRGARRSGHEPRSAPGPRGCPAPPGRSV